MVYPREIDLDNNQKLAQFEATEIVASIEALQVAVDLKLQSL